MILRNENLTNQLVKSSSINLLAQICEMLIHPTININFVALQVCLFSIMLINQACVWALPI